VGRPVISGVYSIHSCVNGRSYIGSSVDVMHRWQCHRKELRNGVHGNTHLQRAWDKYSESAFEFTVLEECSRELLLEREQHYIDSCSDRYNLLPTAGSPLGATLSEETKAKIGAAQKGRVVSDETRARTSASLMGHEVSTETRRKIGDASRGRKASPETRAKMSAALKGRTHSPEARAKLSAALKGRTFSPETRAKMSASAKARRAQKQVAESENEQQTH
jgi:plasmid stability protein